MKKIFFLLFLLSTVLILSGCQKDVECKVASDCGSNSACITHTCTIDGACISNVEKNCCGNNICEESTFENSCTCDDCGSCVDKGRVNYNISTTKGSKLVQTKYSVYACNQENACVIDSDPKLTVEQKYANSFDELGYFKMNTLFTLDEPFNTQTDKLKIRLSLADLNQKTVVGGLTITGIQVLNQNSLLAEKTFSFQFDDFEDVLNEEIVLLSAQPDLEEEIVLSVKIDYSYTPILSGKIGELRRKSQKLTVASQKITFINPAVQN